MIDLIEEKETGFDLLTAYRECRIDLDKTVERPPIAMGIGHHTYMGEQYLNPTFTYGEMSAIVAPKKSKKTFLKTALVASYIGGNATRHFPSIISRRTGEKHILDIDTEQGEFYAQAAAKRVERMVGHRYKNYHPFTTKGKTGEYRVNLIDALVRDYKDVGLLVIDGIADLCPNFNNVDKSYEAINKLMEWSKMGIHIIGVIHKTYEKEKARGHLGTLFQEKIETSIFLKNTDKDKFNAPIEVRNEDSRGAPFKTFYFDLDTDKAIPKECENEVW